MANSGISEGVLTWCRLNFFGDVGYMYMACELPIISPTVTQLALEVRLRTREGHQQISLLKIVSALICGWSWNGHGNPMT